ncbi:MAG: hypothetical protein ACREXS_18300, partial [Gammaproteobacteria bacterium]
YDLGHIDAPVTLFSKRIAQPIALAWHRLRRTGLAKESIIAELENVHYFSTTAVKRILERHGRVHNVFVPFAMHSLKSRYAYRMGHLKAWLHRHLDLAELAFTVLVLLRIEPQCYYILKKTDRA